MATGVNAMLLKIFGDAHDYAMEAHYCQRAVELDNCDPTSATYVQCLGHNYQRLIILYRHHLNQPQTATEW